jgi:hypothetical protein
MKTDERTRFSSDKRWLTRRAKLRCAKNNMIMSDKADASLHKTKHLFSQAHDLRVLLVLLALEAAHFLRDLFQTVA